MTRIKWMLRTRLPRVVRGLIAAGALVTLSAAAAYACRASTTTATQTEAVAVAAAVSRLSVNFGQSDGVLLYPGSSQVPDVSFTVTNSTSGNVGLRSGSYSASILSDAAGNILQNGLPVVGCEAAWFAPSVTPPPDVDLAPTQSTGAGYVNVKMLDVNQPQDACKGAKPDVQLSIADAG
jgi:hypothetical protein